MSNSSDATAPSWSCFAHQLGSNAFRKFSVSRQTIVPEGRMTIAQCFSIGLEPRKWSRPEGTAEDAAGFGRPFGTCSPRTAGPNAEALGYSHASLRDEHEILAALGLRAAGLGGPPVRRPKPSVKWASERKDGGKVRKKIKTVRPAGSTTRNNPYSQIGQL